MANVSRLSTVRVFLFVFSTLILCGCSIEQDRADAQRAAAHVHTTLKANDFVAIYRESAPRFKTVGSESEFVSRMKAFQDQNGSLNKVV
jgi:hypothetical protein